MLAAVYLDMLRHLYLLSRIKQDVYFITEQTMPRCSCKQIYYPQINGPYGRWWP